MGRFSRLFTKIVGPAAVIAAGTMGAGAAASLILAGAWFRYDLLWVILVILPLFVIFVDSASRIGLLNPDKGMFSLIRTYVHPSAAWIILAINVPVHLLVGMGQMSVMTSAFLSIFSFYPPTEGVSEAYAVGYKVAEVALSLLAATGIYWLLSSGGYQRMQRAMTGLMVVMFVCFFIVAMRGFAELPAIMSGFVPKIPADLPVPGTDLMRISGGSIMAIIGSALAPAALLGISYMSADNKKGEPDLKRELRMAVINLGLIFGCYSIFVIIAGGFALYPLANHAQIDTIHEASKVLVNAFPAAVGFIGPLIFSVGILMAALTTFIVVVQVISYWLLDMFGYSWHDTIDNRKFKRLLQFWVFAPAILAPFWSFPALLKVLLLAIVNALIVPLVMLTIIILVNRRQVMGLHKATALRNLTLFVGFVMSVWIATEKLPGYIEALL